MTVYAALFRGLNVGGRTAKMAVLREALAQAGFANVATYVQSGNVVLTSDDAAETVRARIEDVFQTTFGYASRVSLRDADAWNRIVAANPFHEAEPNRLHAVLLEGAPGDGAEGRLGALARPSERYAFGDGVLYLHTPEGFGASKLAASLDRALGVPLTARNWRTVLALAEMMAGLAR